MQDLYRQMYLKYAPNLSEAELNKKVSYAMEQDQDAFINAFYNKYTGGAPSAEQSQYIQKKSGFWERKLDNIEIGLNRVVGDLVAGAEQLAGIPADLSDQWDDLKEQANAIGQPGFQWSDISKLEWKKLSGQEKLANRKQFKENGFFGFATSADIDKRLQMLHAKQPEYDQSIADAIKNGDLLEAGDRILDGGLSSWTSYLSMLHPRAIAALAVSHAGGKWDENFMENPEMANGLLFLNGAGTGLIEYGGDMLARRFILQPAMGKYRDLMKLGDASAKNAVKDLAIGQAGRFLKTTGLAMAGEGGFEMAQALAVDWLDSVDKIYGTDITIGIGQDEEWNKIISGDRKKWHEIYDEGIIGAFMGGGVNVALQGVNSLQGNTAQRRAEVLLRPKHEQEYIDERMKRLNTLQQDILQTDDQAVRDRLNAEQDILSREIVLKQSQTSKVVRMLEGADLMSYATNVDIINTNSKKLANKKKPVSAETANLLKQDIDKAIADNKKLYKDHLHKSLNNNLNTSQAYANAAGVNQVVVDNQDDYQKAYEESEIGKKQSITDGYFDNVRDTDGFFDGSGNWYINKEQALKTEAISVGSHELLHGILKSTVQDENGNLSQQGQKLVKEFMAKLSPRQQRVIQRRIDANYRFQRDADGNIMKDAEGKNIENDFETYGEEYLNVYSDAIIKKEIKLDESVADRLMNFFQGKFREKGINKNFEDGLDVYEFLKTYNRKIQAGEVDPELVEMLKQSKDTPGGMRRSMSVIRRTGDLLTDVDAFVNTNQTKESFQNNFPIELTYLFEDGDASTGNPENDQAMNAIKRDFDGLVMKGIQGKGLYGKDRDTFLRDVKERLMIKSYREFDPTKNESFFGWLTGGKILGFVKGDVSNEYKADYMKSLDADREGKDGSTLQTQVADTSLNPEEAMIAQEEEAQQQNQIDNLRTDLGIKPEDKIYTEVIDANEAALSGAVDMDNVIEALTTSFKNRITDKLVDIFGKGKAYQAWLDKYAVATFKKLRVRDLVQLEREVPANERIFTKVVKKNLSPEEIRAHEKKYGHTENLYYESETQGPTLYAKLDPTVDQIKAFMLVPIKNPKTGKRSGLRGNRKTRVAELAATELGFDATMEVVQSPSVRESDVLENNKNWLKADIAELGRKIQRDPKAKFSRSLHNELRLEIIEGGIMSVFNNKFEFKNKALREKYAEIRDEFLDKIIDNAYTLIPAKARRKIEQLLPASTKGRGFIFEELVFKTLNTFNIPGFSTIGTAAEQGKGGKADMAASMHGKRANAELKLDKDSQFSSINFGEVDLATGNYIVAGQKKLPRFIQRAINKQFEDALPHLQAYQKEASRLIKEYNRENGTKIPPVTNSNSFIPLPVWEKLGGKNGLAVQISNNSLYTDKNGRILKWIYNNKPGEGNQVYLIEILESGLFGMNNKDIGGGLIPELDAEFTNKLRIKSSGSVGYDLRTGKIVSKKLIDGKNVIKGYKPEMSIIPLLTNLRSKSKLSLLRKSDVKKITKASFSKSTVAALENNNKILFSKSLTLEESIRRLKNMDKALRMSRRKNAPKKGLSILDFDDTLATSNSMVIVKRKMDPAVLRKYDNDNIETNLSLAEDSGSIQRINLKSYWNEQLKKSKKIDKLATTKSAEELRAAVKKAKGEQREMLEVALYRKFQDFKDEVDLTGMDIMTGEVMKITPAEFADQADKLEAQGYEFDFREFNDVIDGKKGPFFDKAMALKKKFGNTDIFILTARPAEAAPAIQKFLKGVGLDIPLENITGLADGRPEAKAEFIVEKAANGYNDFLFADDAIKNVKAVKTTLDILDVKGKVYQARPKFSKSQKFAEILAENNGIDPNEDISVAAAKIQGSVNNKFEFWMPPSAEDFVGLLYQFIGKGKTGEAQMKFLQENLVDPFSRSYRMLNNAKQRVADDFKAIKIKHEDVWSNTNEEVGYKSFTYGDAIRVYLWNRAGINIPGTSQQDIDTLVDIVESYDNVMAFANDLELITRLDTYPQPTKFWFTTNITADLYDVAQRINRKQYLQEWIDNKNEIFTPQNMNRIEAIHGSHFREALEDMLWRMENGTNRKTSKNRQVNQWLDWVNNSVGAIMFFNIRSAMLQTISFANFINWSYNNPLKAAEAFSNQEQFWADFSMIFNSNTLKQRRAGLQTDVNAAEMARAVRTGEGSVNAAIAYILKIGFTPTQMADSFAISFGGATMYRNNYNRLIEQGLTEKQAHETAMNDFLEASEKAQQSARPDMISQQQAGPLGRLILAFQNTPMQYMRLTKKAFLDLKNQRGDVKTNISKIVYYTTVQNILFSGLQSALFMMMGFSDDEEAIEDKKIRALNTSLDTILRGGGIGGATISTFKNMLLSFKKEADKGYRGDYARTLIEAANISPPIGSKLRKVYNSFISYKYNKDEIAGLGFHPDNPAILGVANFISGTTNIPLDRAVMIVNNIRASADSDNQAWQRIAMLLGWNSWDVGVERPTYNFRSTKTKKKTRKKKSR